MRSLIPLILLLIAGQVLARPGDELTVTGWVVNMRVGPSMNEEIIFHVEKGQRLVEVRRQDNWFLVETGLEENRSGWIHITQVESDKQDVQQEMKEGDTGSGDESEVEAREAAPMETATEETIYLPEDGVPAEAVTEPMLEETAEVVGEQIQQEAPIETSMEETIYLPEDGTPVAAATESVPEETVEMVEEETQEDAMETAMEEAVTAYKEDVSEPVTEQSTDITEEIVQEDRMVEADMDEMVTVSVDEPPETQDVQPAKEETVAALDNHVQEETASTAVVVEPAFASFRQDFIVLNKQFKTRAGKAYFSNLEHKGSGVIEITATEEWLGYPIKKRNDDLVVIFDLWGAAMGKNTSISVDVLDRQGERRMYMFR